jgi:predicted nucleic acid-binding protein
LIFVDTGAWYAAEVEDDVNHAAARKFLVQLSKGTHGAVVTTDYVLDEVMTLLKSRRNLSSATSFLDKIRSSSSSVKIAWVDESLFKKGSNVFSRSEGRKWSFTDCTSFALMRQLSVSDAFAFDRHFREAGFAVFP